MKKHESNKYITLEDVRVSYNPKDDTIHLTSGDPDLQTTGFHINLNPGTRTENSLRTILTDQGIITTHIPTQTPNWKPNGKTLSIMSPKGGTGKTTLAYSLATILAEQGLKIALIDADFRDANISYFISQHTPNINTYIEDTNPHKTIKNHMVTTQQGWDTLLASNQPHTAEKITNLTLKNILNELKQHYDLIIIDSAADTRNLTNQQLWKNSDYIICCLANTITHLEAYLSLQKRFDQDPLLKGITNKIGIVVNYSMLASTVNHWETKVDTPIIAAINLDRNIPQATADGTLGQLLTQRNPYTKTIKKIANAIKNVVN